MAVTCDSEHKFELALQLGDLKTAYTIVKESEVGYVLFSYFLNYYPGTPVKKYPWTPVRNYPGTPFMNYPGISQKCVQSDFFR